MYPLVTDRKKPRSVVAAQRFRSGIAFAQALAWAIDEKGIKAGLDVFCDEPGTDGPWTTALAAKPGVYGTHHIGASTEQRQAGGILLGTCSLWATCGI